MRSQSQILEEDLERTKKDFDRHYIRERINPGCLGAQFLLRRLDSSNFSTTISFDPWHRLLMVSGDIDTCVFQTSQRSAEAAIDFVGSNVLGDYILGKCRMGFNSPELVYEWDAEVAEYDLAELKKALLEDGDAHLETTEEAFACAKDAIEYGFEAVYRELDGRELVSDLWEYMSSDFGSRISIRVVHAYTAVRRLNNLLRGGRYEVE